MGSLASFDKITDAKTVKEALGQIGADFKAVKEDVFVGKEYLRATRYSAIMREDTSALLHIPSQNYGIVQYLDSFKSTEELLTSGAARFTHGKCIGDGERVFLMMTDDEKLDLEGLIIQNNFLLTSSHDSSALWSILSTPVIMQHSLVMTPYTSGAIRTRHSKHVGMRIEKIHTKLGQVKKMWAEFKDSAYKLASTAITMEQAQEYFTMVVTGDGDVSEGISAQASNAIDRMVAIFLAGPQNVFPSCKMTMLGAYFAVTFWCDNDKVVRTGGTSRYAGNPKSAMVLSAVDGAGAKQKAEGYAKLLKLARLI